MNRLIHRRALLRAGFAASLPLLIPAARACEFFTTNLRIFHPWTRATADGDTVALLCMTFDDVTLTDRLIGVETPVARHAEMGGAGPHGAIDLPIPAGRETALSETGRFIRLTGLRHPLQIGRSYPLKLVFERGGAVAADIDVDYEPIA
jgi:copper(I)-binding protein